MCIRDRADDDQADDHAARSLALDGLREAVTLEALDHGVDPVSYTHLRPPRAAGGAVGARRRDPHRRDLRKEAVPCCTVLTPSAP